MTARSRTFGIGPSDPGATAVSDSTATDQRLRDPRAAQGVVARSLATPATLVQGEQASRVVMPLCALASGLGLLIACRALQAIGASAETSALQTSILVGDRV